MNFKVSFYLRSNYENKEGKSPVMLRVFLNGEMANFGSTKIFVDKTLWNNTGSRLKGRTTEALSVNAALDSISTTLNSIFHKFENDETLSLDKIRSYFVGKDREYTTLLSFLCSISSMMTSGSVLVIPSVKTACRSTVSLEDTLASFYPISTLARTSI